MKRRLVAWWAKRKPRERALAVVALLVAIGATVDSTLLAPTRAVATKIERQLAQARSQVKQLQQLAEQREAQGDAVTRERLAALTARRTAAERVIGSAQTELVAPADMTQHLANVLAQHPNVRVIAAASSAPTPLAEAPNPNGAPAKSAPGGAVLYQHGLELKIEGRYLDLLSYLDALDQSPQRLYWRELDLQVGTDGVPVTRLSLYTVSREAQWLRL